MSTLATTTDDLITSDLPTTTEMLTTTTLTTTTTTTSTKMPVQGKVNNIITNIIMGLDICTIIFWFFLNFSKTDHCVSQL
jgi:hypothetical protein